MPLTTHFDEDRIEAYALGRLPQDETVGLEEHLLICSVCQERLERADDFVRAFRVAANASKPEPAKKPPTSAWFSWIRASWQPFPMAAALAIAAIAVVALAPRKPAGLEGETVVMLAAMRGGDAEAIGVVPSHRRLHLDLDATGLTGPTYRVELADSRGRQLWQSTTPAAIDDGHVKAGVGRSVPPGLYWVRLYDPASGQLAREYGLRAQ